MSPETAWTVHLVVLGVGVLVWLIAARVHVGAFRLPDTAHPEILGADETEVPAEPAAVREKIVEAFQASAGTVAIEQADDRTVAGRITVVTGKSSTRPIPFEIVLSRAARGTRANWVVKRDRAGVDGLRIASLCFLLVLTPLAMITAAFLVQGHAIPSDDPDVRAQAWQTVQIVHLLWPPFLFTALRRMAVRNAMRAIGNVVSNAAF